MSKVIAQRLYTDATKDKNGVPAARITTERGANARSRIQYDVRFSKLRKAAQS